MKKRNIAGAFLAAPAILLAAYLISLPVSFIALSWYDGRYAFLIETAYIVSFAAAGFFGLRPLNRLLRDDGSGDTYLLCSLFLVLLILALFRENEKYAMPLAGLLYPEDLRYRPEPDFPSGSAAENLRNLARYSAVSICTYTASFCMSFAHALPDEVESVRAGGNRRAAPILRTGKSRGTAGRSQSIRKRLRTGEHSICRRFRFRKSEERDQRKV